MKTYRVTLGSGRVTTTVTVEAEDEAQATVEAQKYDPREVVAIKEDE